MKKFDVMHVITSLGDGGAEGVLYRLVNQTKKDINHYIICLGPKKKYFFKYKKINVQVLCLNLNLLNFLSKTYLLYKTIKRVNPRIVQTWLYHSDLIGGVLAKICKIKNIYWNIRTGEISLKNNKILTLFIIFLCTILSYFIPNKIISCSMRAQIVHKRIGYKDIFYNIDNGYIIPSKKTKKEIFRTKLKNNYFLIGMVARYHSVKNHNLLIEAIKILNEKINNFRVILIGTGINNKNTELKNKIKKLRLTNKFILKDSSNNINKYFEIMDLHVLPSFSEGFPNVIGEAMLNFTPCLATDVGASKKILSNYGKIISPINPKLLAKEILYFYNLKNKNKKNWRKLTLNCSKHIEKNFSLEKMVSEYKKIWKI